MLGGILGGEGGRRTFVAENSTGLEDTWMRMRSFFFSVVGGIFHFDDINIFFPRCCCLFFFFPCCLFVFFFFFDNRRCSSNTRRRRRKSNFNRFSLTTNFFDGMFKDLRNQLEREVEEAERFGGCFGESGSGARFGGRGRRWRCSGCGCIGRRRLCRRRHFLNVLLRSGGWRGVLDGIFSFSKGWVWAVVYVYSGRYGLYIYIYIYV